MSKKSKYQIKINLFLKVLKMFVVIAQNKLYFLED